MGYEILSGRNIQVVNNFFSIIIHSEKYQGFKKLFLTIFSLKYRKINRVWRNNFPCDNFKAPWKNFLYS